MYHACVGRVEEIHGIETREGIQGGERAEKGTVQIPETQKEESVNYHKKIV